MTIRQNFKIGAFFPPKNDKKQLNFMFRVKQWVGRYM